MTKISITNLGTPNSKSQNIERNMIKEIADLIYEIKMNTFRRVRYFQGKWKKVGLNTSKSATL